jgi:hypothetical protein
LERNGSGSGHLKLNNRTTEPSVMKLRNQAGAVVVSVFLAPGGHVELDGLPDIRFGPEFAVGEFWSRACRTFAAGMRAQRVPGLFSLEALTPLTIPPDLPGGAQPVDIPERAFNQE